MTQRPKLIGISGKAGSGKTTAAFFLGHLGYEPIGFADLIKEIAGEVLGFIPEQLHGCLKEAIDPRFGHSPRYCLQSIGNVFRELWPEVWVWNVKRKIMRFNGPVIVTDVRFQNEARMIKELGGHLIRLERQGAGVQNGIPGHNSETDLDHWQEWDLVIQNNGTEKEFYRIMQLWLEQAAENLDISPGGFWRRV